MLGDEHILKDNLLQSAGPITENVIIPIREKKERRTKNEKRMVGGEVVIVVT